MRIAFLISRFDAPSSRYRVLQYLPIFKNKGHKSEVFEVPKGFVKRTRLFIKMRNFDVVVLQKKLLSAIDWHLLRKNSHKLIYDFDDAVMFRDSDKKGFESAIRQKRFTRTIKNSDMVVSGNEYLNSFAMKENSNVFVIPTSIDMKRYIQKPFDSISEHVIIGWIGSGSTLPYLEKMKNVWDAVFDKFPHVKLKVIADRFFECQKMPVVKKQWKHEEEIDDLHSFDIGIMPLPDDLWTRGKCGFKLLQYMAIGIPAVCSPVGINKEIVSDGVNGYWANAADEWVEKLGILIRDRNLRLQMGDLARKTVINRYSVGVNVKRLIEIILNR